MTPKQVAGAKWAVAAVAVGLAALVPQVNEPFRVNQFSTVMTYALAALGLALLTGFSGQISIGHGAFMGVGAYTTAILVADHGFPWLASTVVAAVLCFCAGALVGIPALRIRGPALALATLGLAVLFPQIIKRFSSLTGGSAGKPVASGFAAPSGSGIAPDQWTYYIILAFLVLALLLARNLVKSRVGRALVAIRDNEVAAEVLGVNLAAYKILVFGVSAMLAGIGGSLGVYITQFVDAGQFDILLSIQLLVQGVVGGIATVVGPVVGAGSVYYINQFISENFSDRLQQLTPVIFGAALIALMMVMPDGIVGGLHRAWARLFGLSSGASRKGEEADDDEAS
jgi:branched-chain amino acid transport system permease protein